MSSLIPEQSTQTNGSGCITERLLAERIVAIFRGYTGDQADEAASALIRGGIRLLEVTMNTEGAPAIIYRWRQLYEDRAFIGAGTVLDVEMAREAISSGAQFLISPNLDEAVIEYASARGIDVWPGVFTPTEMVRAWKAGAKALKLFPLGALGPEYIREVRGPLAHIPILATGGIDLGNAASYWAAGASAFGLGSKLARADYIHNRQFDKLEDHARHWVQTVQSF
ncbi:bifunctional 4-hydroxy-2-oxoglutarate aldolase/2-dehydro-3-deoxy-phosphogluconate aldolase [Paenibacillus sp. ACRRX]|uniref:bifunctional 4-hydroxy-2-oxoglutarate aldolase/2-dehydro-3-deoxy-phosphogluconate aldolase n=1 Tax=Paenibacillus sp. ACRRX TaxID=2918206 RepID=UPI001EF5545F|nr:bifunctional 4-hydroxy-2-oxoglutarate aldolase/2-dehydro-3-deoxy-phosphogluconate aldolase [Paenibacillus sp. ACRRX]MCG7409065.1 bifunctional 4-hydroxy-2-oxoglutarate aldolase/2-dehydro-3-deoxy-phosphogluconate aldolase [Paenibacillus sp. ACRRX]